jgi:hypothetical protein
MKSALLCQIVRTCQVSSASSDSLAVGTKPHGAAKRREFAVIFKLLTVARLSL